MSKRRRSRKKEEADALAEKQREIDEENEAILEELYDLDADLWDDGNWMFVE